MTNAIPELVISDPHHQPGLVERIPEGVGPERIVNFYHYFLFPQQKAYCAKCGARRHRDGFTVELDDGTLALAGSTCGSDLWGERWRAVHGSFQTKLHAAGYILDARQVLAELESIRSALVTSWRPVVSMLNTHQNRFKSWMQPFYAALRTAALRSDHCLDRPGREPFPVEGWAFFAIDDTPRRFQKALDQIDAAIVAGQGHETALGAHTVNIAEAREELDVVARAHRALRLFFASMDLSIIVEAVNRSITGTDERPYCAQGQSIMHIASETVIGLPPDYPVPATEPLRKLRDLK